MDGYLHWAELFAKHKDLLKKEIVGMHVENDMLIIQLKKGSEVYVSVGTNPLNVIVPRLDILCRNFDRVWIVVKNDKEKLDQIVSLWDDFSKRSRLRVWFIDLVSDKKWAVNPYAHSLVAPKGKLRFSLETLRNAV